MSFADGDPYFPLYFGASLVSWRLWLMCLIISVGIPFLYSVVHRSVLLIAPNAFDRPTSILASRLALCTYCPTWIMESMVDIPSL